MNPATIYPGDTPPLVSAEMPAADRERLSTPAGPKEVGPTVVMPAAAPEVAARIARLWTAGGTLSEINSSLHMAPRSRASAEASR